jgi:hypothetical protein
MAGLPLASGQGSAWEVIFQFFGKLFLAILLIFQAQPDQRTNRLAHTDVDTLSVPLHLSRDART